MNAPKGGPHWRALQGLCEAPEAPRSPRPQESCSPEGGLGLMSRSAHVRPLRKVSARRPGSRVGRRVGRCAQRERVGAAPRRGRSTTLVSVGACAREILRGAATH